jgi:hypothetical protein
MEFLIGENKVNKAFLVRIFCLACIIQFLLTPQLAFADQPASYILLLKEMFTKVTVEKNAKAIPAYYCKDFELYSNGKTIKFKEFLQLHQTIYKTPIQYQVRYDEKTLLEQGNKVAGRLFITTKKPNEIAQEIEVMLVAEYKENKLYRLWELTYPDWSKAKDFQKVSE